MIDFLGFSPSTIAAAAVLCIATEEDQATALFHDIVNRVIIHSSFVGLRANFGFCWGCFYK